MSKTLQPKACNRREITRCDICDTVYYRDEFKEIWMFRGCPSCEDMEEHDVRRR